MKSPTVSQLAGDGGYAVETVVEKAGINTLIPDAQGRRRHRHPRAAAHEDRPLMAACDVDRRGHRVRRASRARRGHDGRRHRLPLPLHPDRRRHPHHRGGHRGGVRAAGPARPLGGAARSGPAADRLTVGGPVRYSVGGPSQRQNPQPRERKPTSNGAISTRATPKARPSSMLARPRRAGEPHELLPRGRAPPRRTGRRRQPGPR